MQSHGADVVTLDADCHPGSAAGPAPAYFVDGHLAVLAGGPRRVPSVQEDPARGLPYLDPGRVGRTAVHMGTWAGAGDFDAPQALAMMRAGGRELQRTGLCLACGPCTRTNPGPCAA